MGVFLDFYVIPQRIPSDKWESVYEEAMRIVDGCGFMDRIYLERNGRKYAAARKSAERNVFDRGLGINICGTMESGFDMEDFTLYRDLSCNINRDKSLTDNGIDVIFSNCYSDRGSVPMPSCSRNIWGGKTQGCLGHLPLLGIACLFAQRFPDAVTVGGDISAGQCRSAVDFVNQFLESPIDTPVICHPLSLAKRIRNANISAHLHLSMFFKLYLGVLSAEVGVALKQVFPYEDIYRYFRDNLAQESPDKYRFRDILRDYMLLEFDFSDLLKMLINDPDGNGLPLEAVLKELLSYKIHVPLEEKNTSDPGDLSNATQGEGKGPSSVEGLLGRVFFRMTVGRNKTLPVYVPLETIRNACKEFGEGTDALIDRLLSEQDADQVQEKAFGKGKNSLMDLVEQKSAELQVEYEEQQTYDIGELRDIFTCRPGGSIEPQLKQRLVRTMQQIQNFDLENDFQEFLSRDQIARENTFIQQSRYILIWENTWSHIFTHIMDNDYIRRYYYLFRVDCSGQGISSMMEPLLSNPEFIDWLWDEAMATP